MFELYSHFYNQHIFMKHFLILAITTLLALNSYAQFSGGGGRGGMGGEI